MSTFTLDIAKFIEKAKANADEVIRTATTEIFRRIVYRSPVGNPELWAANAVAAQYNTEVQNYNTALGQDPANLNKRGHLKPGRKLHDGMDVKAPAGYVGGRFRGNWVLSFNSPATGVIDRIDGNGGTTIATEAAKLDGFTAGTVIYIVNNLPYAHRLEYESWSKQAPAGMVGVTIAEFQQVVDDAVKSLL